MPRDVVHDGHSGRARLLTSSSRARGLVGRPGFRIAPQVLAHTRQYCPQAGDKDARIRLKTCEMITPYGVITQFPKNGRLITPKAC
jgi:hypothetical protein